MNHSTNATRPTDPALFPAAASDLAALSDRLATAADEQRLLDVGYRTIDSPIGCLLIAATAEGLVRVAFENEHFESVLASLADRISPRVLEAPRRLDQVAVELEEYFEQKRRVFDVPLDHRLSSGFRQVVQRHLTHIPYGTTRSYKEVADQVGNPRAVRAVGSACATNPLPVVVPCHRVLRSDGTMGGYAGGLAIKRRLLELEGAA